MNSKIISNGPKEFQKSKTYLDKDNAIKEETKTKYKFLFDKEHNFIKRIILKLRMEIEIRRKISKLRSLDKMYLQFK
jgi:hypothetical protein